MKAIKICRFGKNLFDDFCIFVWTFFILCDRICNWKNTNNTI